MKKGEEGRADGGEASGPPPARRAFLETASSAAMAGGLLAGYGTFACLAGRLLFPARGLARGWVFVTDEARVRAGDSIPFTGPTGMKLVIARKRETGSVDDFVALSSTCPHLGCQVHWEAPHNRFFCPCHNGTFAPEGIGTGGPPARAGQSLLRYPLKLDRGKLFVQVPLEGLAPRAGRRDSRRAD